MKLKIVLAALAGAAAIAIQMANPVTVYADPVLVDVTGYCEGTIGSHGDRMRRGICAGRPEDYGKACLVYEAVPGEAGYEIGDLLYYLEILDTGYGRSTGTGKSKVLDGKPIGTIEGGQQIDIYRPSLEECVEVMEATKGKAFVQILEAEG